MSSRSWLVVGAAVAAVLGPVSLWLGHGPTHVAEGIPWLVAGWVAVAAGLAVDRVAHRRTEAALLVLAGLAWLVPDVRTCLDLEPFTHRCLVVEPLRPAAALIDWLWLGCFVGALAAMVVGSGSDRRAWLAAAGAALAIGIPILLAPDVPYALELGFIVAAGVVLAESLLAQAGPELLTADRVVELAPALAGALGDSSFRIVIRPLEGEGWLGLDGLPTAEPAGPATPVTRGGVELARIVHDQATLDDPELRSAVLTAVELVAHNVRLRDDLERQSRGIAVSRRRLVDAGFREQEELARQVDADVTRRLEHLASAIGRIHDVRSDGPVDDRLGAAARRVDVARNDVEGLLRGVYPPALRAAGLIAALRDVADNAPIPVDLDVPGEPLELDIDIAACLYFVCAEAVANTARHAGAGSVRISLSANPHEVTLRVEDAGVGGASLDAGTGLRGLRDRIVSMDGQLELDSPPGAGTRLVVTLPVSDEARRVAASGAAVTPPWSTLPSSTR